jgi:hypothetical protein
VAHDGARAAQQSDTTPRALARYYERLRATPPREKLARALLLSDRVRAATMADVERPMPGASREALSVAFVRRVYGEPLARRLAERLSRSLGLEDLLDRALASLPA